MHRPGIYTFLRTFAGRLFAASVSLDTQSLGLRKRCQVALWFLAGKYGVGSKDTLGLSLTFRVFVIFNPDQLKNNLHNKGLNVISLCFAENTYPYTPLAKR